MAEKFKPHKHMLSYSANMLRALATPTISYIIITGNIVLLASAFLFFMAEQPANPAVRGFLDAIWWAFSTVTTVGYGDIVPVTGYGRMIGVVLMISGAVFFFGFTAILITGFSTLTSAEFEKSERLTLAEYEDVARRLDQISERLARLEEHLRAKDS